MHSKEQINSEAEIPTTISSEIPLGVIIIGTVTGVDQNGVALVDYPNNPEATPLVAISTLGINHMHKDRQVALLFANGDARKPVIVGMIHNPLQELIENFEVTPLSTNDDVELWPSEKKLSSENENEIQELKETLIDGKRIVFEGQDEIVLKCGEASITLTKAGKIIIRGKYLLNRSSGINRIMGGSVQVN